MKWVFYVIVFVYMCYRAVYGLQANSLVSNHMVSLDDNSVHDDGQVFVEAGERKVISCTGNGKIQVIKWHNPMGMVVPRLPSGRVYSSAYFVQSRTPALLLNITRAEVGDSGVWVCRAGDEVQNVSICVIDPTDFEGTLAEVAADEGRSYTLSCQTRGQPEATISWARNGQDISEFDNEDMPKYRVMTKFNRQGIEGLLTIMSLSVEDSGVYTCISTQKTQLAEKCGLIEHFNITLNINHAPTFGEKKKELVYGTEGENVYLRCEADGHPMPSYKWFIRNGGAKSVQVPDKEIVVAADNGSVLPVQVTEDSFDHQYICRASNQLGDVELVFNILESVEPIKPAEVQILPDLSSSKSLALNVIWNEEIQFDIKKIEVQFMPTSQLPRKRALKEKDWKHSRPYLVPIGDVLEDSTLATLMGLEPSTEYWLRLRVKNDMGDSPWSNSIRAITKEADDSEEEESEEEEEQTKEDRDVEETVKPETATTADDSLVTTEQQETPPSDDSGRFYGIFFAVGIVILVVGCTFIVRMV